MSRKELLTDLDRLTRFKYPLDKKNRVYKEIITKNTLDPKINTNKYNKLKWYQKEIIAKIIWNESLLELIPYKEINKEFNKYISFEETKIFNSKQLLKDLYENDQFEKNGDFEKNSLKKLKESFTQNGYNINSYNSYDEIYIELAANNTFNLYDTLNLIDKDKITKNNLKHLINIKDLQNKNNCPLDKIHRESKIKSRDNKTGFPPRLLLITEGITEEILLPVFSKKLNLDFMQNGIQIIGAGGKNQVARIYYELKDKLNTPILIVLDADAKEQSDSIKEILKDKDDIFLISNGEFEDIIHQDLIIKALNNEYKMEAKTYKKDFVKDIAMTSQLYELFKTKGFGEFKKAEFARLISKNIDDKTELTQELKKIIRTIETIIKKE